MRVRLDKEQVERILWALRNDHLCDECEYDSWGNTISGTECLTYKLIKKFERVYSGSATEAGRRGGISSVVSRLKKDSDYRGQISELEGGLSYYRDKKLRVGDKV